MRLIRISLAVKYRILFGLAVLLITSAALVIPWYRMGALVLEQPFREAQRAVDDYFRLVLTTPDHTPPGGDLHGRTESMLTGQALIRPRFHRYTPNSNDPESVVNAAQADPFLADATKTFLVHPKTKFLYKTEQGSTGTLFRYAHAVRVDRTCLACHDRGKTATPFREHDLAGFITVDVPATQADQYLLFNHLWLIFGGALAGVNENTGLMLSLHNWGGTHARGTADPDLLADKYNVVAICVDYIQSGDWKATGKKAWNSSRRCGFATASSAGSTSRTTSARSGGTPPSTWVVGSTPVVSSAAS